MSFDAPAQKTSILFCKHEILIYRPMFHISSSLQFSPGLQRLLLLLLLSSAPHCILFQYCLASIPPKKSLHVLFFPRTCQHFLS